MSKLYHGEREGWLFELEIDERTRRCKALLQWYRRHPYLVGADSEYGERYRLLGKMIGEAIDGMPAELKAVIQARYLEGLSTADVVKAIGTSETRYFIHCFQAYRALAMMWSTDVITEWGRWIDGQN